MNQALYSVTAYPGMVQGVLYGIIIDNILGIRISMVLFSSITLIGMFVFYLGVQFTFYELIIIGWTIYSLGGSTLTRIVFIGRWFMGGRGVSFAFALSVAVGRAAASSNFYFTPRIGEQYGVHIAALVGTLVCAISTSCAIALVFIDRYAEKKKILAPQELGDWEIDEHTGEKTKVAAIDRIKTIFYQIRTFPPQLWLISFICVCLYGSDVPFVGYAMNFFETKYSLSNVDAGGTLSIYQLTAAVACPLAGIICDKVGRNSYIMALTSVSFVLIHIIMILTYIPPSAAMIIFGIFYSFLVSGLWPSVLFVVSQRVSGTSYGVMGSLESIGTIHLIIGVILDTNLEENNGSNSGAAQTNLKGYYYAEGVLISLAAI